MAKASLLISSFNAGELSPLLGGRPDTEKYQAGLSLCQNFIPRVQGALERRGGTVFVSEVKDSSKPVRLIRFEYAIDDCFILEFGDLYIRFYRDRGVFIDGGSPYEIVSPYSVSDLTNSDGSCGLDFAQSGDVIYIANRNHPPQKLTRIANNNWTIAAANIIGGPFQTENTDQTWNLQASAASGSGVTITANKDTFTSNMVGSLVKLTMQDASSIKPWYVNSYMGGASGVVVGTKCYSDGKYYHCSTVPAGTNVVTGSVKPIHTAGAYWDGDGKDIDDHLYGPIGVEWTYDHAGYGWAKITGFTDARHVTVTVLSNFPDEVVSGSTWRWQLAHWSDALGWPEKVTFFRERLVFARDRYVWCSQAADYENFKALDYGQVLNSSAITIELVSGRGDAIKWLMPGPVLLAGTGSTCFTVSESTTYNPFGPDNVKTQDQQVQGCNGVGAVSADQVLFVQRGGRILNECAYSSQDARYSLKDVTIFAEHMTLTGLVDMAYAKLPHSVIWVVRADGGLRGFTYQRDEGVAGWHNHPLGGSGFVESIAVIPSPDLLRDELWLVVRRTINGVTKRYIEYLSPEYRDGDDQALTCYSDCSLTYSGASTLTLSGINHLEGCTVNVKVNGAYHPPCVVSGGAITLQRSATKATVGLPAPSMASIMPLEAGGEGGTAQGMTKRIEQVYARVYNSLGGKFGMTFDLMEEIEARTPNDAMDEAPPLISDMVRVLIPGDYAIDAEVAILCDKDYPFTLVALAPRVTAGGD